MTDTPLPSLSALRASAIAAFGVLCGAILRHDGSLDWREVPPEQAARGREVARLAGVVVSLLHGDRSVYSLPPSPALEYLAHAFRDSRLLAQIVELAWQVDAVRGSASSREETVH